MWQLKQLQTLSLQSKIARSERKIKEWYHHWEGDVYVSFSGGKDSTVLLDLVRKQYPKVPAVFFDTGLEYPEIRDFVKTIDNVEWIKPKKTFKTILEEYGYPVVSKDVSQKIYDYRTTKSEKLKNIRLHGNAKGQGKLPAKWRYLLKAPFKISDRCCHVMKKNPAKSYERKTGRKAMLGTMAIESRLRTTAYLKQGCNAFENSRKTSTPMGFWTEQDVLEYLYTKKTPYCSIYGDIVLKDGEYRTTGENRTGCMFCMFGAHLDGSENKFQKMAETHPKLYKYCIEELGLKEILEYIGCQSKPLNRLFEDF